MKTKIQTVSYEPGDIFDKMKREKVLMRKKMPKNKHKEGDKIGEWKRIFKILPVNTEDGYRVTFGYVWSRKVPTAFDWETLYHTNPNGRESKLQKAKSLRKPHNFDPRRIAPPMPKCKPPLTEGKMRRGNKPPPVGRGKRPPPPPPIPQQFKDAGELYTRVKELEKQIGKYTSGSMGPG